MPSDDRSRIRQLTNSFEKYDGVGGLAWMPDGKIMYDSVLGGKPIVSVMNADGSNSAQLISGVISATVSPNGRFLVYQKGSSRHGDIGLYRFDLNEMSEIRLTSSVDVFPAFSPDGKYTVFKRFGDDQKGTILRIGINGGEPSLITDNASLSYPAISPGGKTVARGDLNTKNLVLLPIESNEPIKKFDVKFSRFVEGICCRATFQWTPDERAVNYVTLKENVSNIWQQPIDGSSPVQVTDFKDGKIFNFAFSANGSSLALSRGTIN
jgi:Tol biopolymer transport system component